MKKHRRKLATIFYATSILEAVYQIQVVIEGKEVNNSRLEATEPL